MEDDNDPALDPFGFRHRSCFMSYNDLPRLADDLDARFDAARSILQRNGASKGITFTSTLTSFPVHE